MTLCSLFCIFQIVIHRRQYFGDGPTLAGGVWGRTSDNSVRTILWTWAQWRVNREFQNEFGATVPPTMEETNRIGVPVLTEAWIRTILLTSWRRRQETETMVRNNNEASSLKIIQPLVGDWYRPLQAKDKQPILWVDVASMDAFMYKEFPGLVSVYPKWPVSQRVPLWALCHIAKHGGVFTSPESKNVLPIVYDANGEIKLQVQVSSVTNELELLIASRQHPRLLCVTRLLSEQAAGGNSFEWEDVVLWLQSLYNMQLFKEGGMDTDNNCRQGDARIPEFLSVKRDAQKISIAGSPRKMDTKDNRWKVLVHDLVEANPRAKQLKRPLSQMLEDDKCNPSWLCHRCLRLPWLGSHKRCSWICRACYRKLMCTDQPPDRPSEVVIEVEVLETKNTTAKRIPRIIHQTWFSELSTTEYPHLQRLQNSWKAMKGWEYRFYTDISAHDFIDNHFPKRFLEAYDAIVVPAFRADFFRLCVLVIHGGVYADIDVLLTTSLDYFITSNLSFFVPRDVNIDMWPQSNYCLWNGLMGSSPGHPVVVKALEDLVNRALNHYDYYDVEMDQCRRDMSAEIWKLRCSPMLLVTGPCALGISASDAIGRENPLEGWDVGWQRIDWTSLLHEPADHDWGHFLILLLDRYDLLEQTFTDVGRNLLVASTNQDQIATRPVHDAVDEHEHYSSFESDVVGSRAYSDSKIRNELVRLHIKHKYV